MQSNPNAAVYLFQHTFRDTCYIFSPAGVVVLIYAIRVVLSIAWCTYPFSHFHRFTGLGSGEQGAIGDAAVPWGRRDMPALHWQVHSHWLFRLNRQTSWLWRLLTVKVNEWICWSRSISIDWLGMGDASHSFRCCRARLDVILSDVAQ